MTPHPSTIIAAVCREFRVPPSVMAGNGKTIDHIQARQAAVLLLRGLTRLSYPEITAAMGMGHRSHSSTIERMHGARARLDADPVFGDRVLRVAVQFDADLRVCRDRYEFERRACPEPGAAYIEDELSRFRASVAAEAVNGVTAITRSSS